MPNIKIIPVVLAGGQGSRLWPLSRVSCPKQLLPIVGDRTMLQATVDRVRHFPNATAPIVICNEIHRFLVAEQLRAANVSQAEIILEPVGCNTAPAAALAALRASRSEGDPYLLVLASDHVIEDLAAFHAALQTAIQAASQGGLVVFGVPPTRAETGYGYIRGVPSNLRNVQTVAEFVEKPDHETATRYLLSGRYLWNSGMFLFKASVFLAELQRFEPDVMERCRQVMANAKCDADFIRLDRDVFACCSNISIDHAVMERTKRAVMVRLDAGWHDIGTWSALWEMSAKDLHGNVETGDVLSLKSSNCYLQSTGDRLVVAVGVKDLIVVDTEDAVLIVEMAKVQQVKLIVEMLLKNGRKEVMRH